MGSSREVLIRLILTAYYQSIPFYSQETKGWCCNRNSNRNPSPSSRSSERTQHPLQQTAPPQLTLGRWPMFKLKLKESSCMRTIS